MGECLPGKGFQLRWINNYLAALNDVSLHQVSMSEINTLYRYFCKISFFLILNGTEKGKFKKCFKKILHKMNIIFHYNITSSFLFTNNLQSAYLPPQYISPGNVFQLLLLPPKSDQHNVRNFFLDLTLIVFLDVARVGVVRACTY